MSKYEIPVSKSDLIKAIKKHPTRFIMGTGSFVHEIVSYKKLKKRAGTLPVYKVKLRTWIIAYHPSVRNPKYIKIYLAKKLDENILYGIRYDDYKEVLKVLKKYKEYNK